MGESNDIRSCSSMKRKRNAGENHDGVQKSSASAGGVHCSPQEGYCVVGRLPDGPNVWICPLSSKSSDDVQSLTILPPGIGELPCTDATPKGVVNEIERLKRCGPTRLDGQESNLGSLQGFLQKMIGLPG